MEKIKRYGRNGGDLEPMKNGKWVKYEDYQAVLKACSFQNKYMAGEVERLSELLSKEFGYSMFLALRLNIALNPPAKEDTDCPF